MVDKSSEITSNAQDKQQTKQEWKFSIDGDYRHIDRPRLSELSRNVEVIIVNDDHPSSFMHTDWIEMVRELHQSGQQPSLLFEMIRDNHQEGLSDFVEGNIPEYKFRTEVYDKSWDWDYRRYAPYFRVAKELKIPAIAADLNKEEQSKYSNKDQPVETYAGTRYVSPRAHQRDLKMTAAIDGERSKGRKPVLLVGGAHFGNQVNILTEKYSIAPEKILLLSEYVDGQHNQGLIEFKPKERKPVIVDRLKPPERK